MSDFEHFFRTSRPRQTARAALLCGNRADAEAFASREVRAAADGVAQPQRHWWRG
ncbi:hypothetical protein [Kutzneria chonburiensis]|uniref:Uncharacterized protein n=1 Tax=Kutzneria chonburiensis TaxID=1483604 RepID=A0ABV6N7D7_9PSEU|nr:hypothetical protein [Kutzneria chonburiensis]